MTTITRGWALAQQERREEPIDQMRTGLAAYRATGSEVLYPHFLALLAEALIKYGRAEEALSVLEEALAMANSNEEAYYLAELYRIKGEALLLQGSGRDSPGVATGQEAGLAFEAPGTRRAAACFNQAIKIAQQQQAKSWELRAALSLSRLFQKQRKESEAGLRLAGIYATFTEGLDTMDLCEAKALLDESESSE